MIKTVAKAHYVHKSNIDELVSVKLSKENGEELKDFLSEINNLGIEYDIVKYNDGTLTLITSPDWDTANEPIVGRCYRWKKGEWYDSFGGVAQPKVSDNFKQVYHNKWQFVGDDYDGFDIKKAKERTLLWNTIPDIKAHKNKIGYKNYWKELLDKNNIKL